MYNVSKFYLKERRKEISSDQDRFDIEFVCFVLFFRKDIYVVCSESSASHLFPWKIQQIEREQ